MEANNPNISGKDRNSILNHIINCANCALQNEDAFQKAMLGLAGELRTVFDSEYCSIGIVSDGYAEDCMISYKKFEDEELSKQQEIFLRSVNRVSVDENNFAVCKALKSDVDIFVLQEEINQFNNYESYQDILASGHVKDSSVIPIRDNDNKNFGFIQFINTKISIDYQRDISPYSDALLGLVQIIITNKKNHQKLIKNENLLKDSHFYISMQDSRDNVDGLLGRIMEYFSDEFNAAVISFRIPVLNGSMREPLFYLRSIYVHPSIGEKKRNNLINHYHSERLVKHKDDICGIDELRCDSHGRIFEGKSNSDFSEYGMNLDDNTLIMPILRDLDQRCIHLDKTKSGHISPKSCQSCIERFKRLYGIFRLRLSKSHLSNGTALPEPDYNEIKERLAYLSKQITLLLNSIVDKHENESLTIFHNDLKKSSFIKIQEFDKQCVEFIRNAVHAKACSIYRYNDRTKYLSLSATTAESIQFVINGMTMYFQTSKIQNSCFVSTKSRNNILIDVFSAHRSLYVFNIMDSRVHQSAFIERVNRDNDRESALAVPIIKKDGTCGGVVLLIGKDLHKHSISTAYWEHDIKHVEFIVNILTRISESDTERLTFLSQLSHELLAPVTELVYDNDLTINIAERNSESITKPQLIFKLRENIDRNMLFKYIITDTEFIYSSDGRTIDYNIVKQDHPRDILLDAIRLMEKEAHAHTLSIKTFTAQLPPLWFDKERMMQVFLNLLKNAIRYSYSQTTINISYERGDDGFHLICFANEGIGVKEEETERIFELFHRGEAAKRKFSRGTGMGLYIVRDIMRAHGGDCFVRRLQNPTEFVIALPNIQDNQ